jgi:AraC-like DNA-binding protein
MPDICCDLVWGHDGLVVTGPMTRAAPSRNVGTEVTLLRLDPMTASARLGVSLADLTNRIVSLADIDRPLAEELEERRARGRLADLVCRDPMAPPDPRIAAAAVGLRRGCRVRQAADHVGLSERQLERLFVGHTGLAPKTFARILRFRGAMRSVSRGVPLSLAAPEAGYADQAHFSRESTAFTGLPPTALRSRHGGNVQDVVAGTI